ncbi:RNA-binding protein [Anaerosporomusa subterranea]|uniref:RNA-binding protein n=1 Tax=Anaerosporomusa subterranea TaxID=1794912 RepID=A0A154BND9_ANASB|nr:YhbY family RNA-binding protein [Anaerosporomusa subterranea]KYZ75385.1 RNA-binding protein [Anaerosporomusa subterranea]
MLTSKQKSYLKSLGSTMDSIVQIGKGGISPTVVDSVRDALTKRELIKVRVLQNSLTEPEDAIRELADQTRADLVQVIGRNGLLYKRNPEKPRIELP